MTHQNDIEYLQSISRITSKNILEVIKERKAFIMDNQIAPETEYKLVTLVNSDDKINIELFFQLMRGMGFESKECLLGFIHFLDMPFVAYTLNWQCLSVDLLDTLGFKFDISYRRGVFNFYYWDFELFKIHVDIHWRLTSKPDNIEARGIFNGRFKRKIIKELKKWSTTH